MPQREGGPAHPPTVAAGWFGVMVSIKWSSINFVYRQAESELMSDQDPLPLTVCNYVVVAGILTDGVHRFGRQRELVAARKRTGRGEAPLPVDVQKQHEQQCDEAERGPEEGGGLHGNCWARWGGEMLKKNS